MSTAIPVEYTEECPVLGGPAQPMNCSGCTESKVCFPKFSEPMYATVNDISYLLGLIDELREVLQR
jgi:hypothetical protein